MNTVEYKQENIENLAHMVIESWDMETLLGYALDRLVDGYQKDRSAFLCDWKMMFEEDNY